MEREIERMITKTAARKMLSSQKGQLRLVEITNELADALQSCHAQMDVATRLARGETPPDGWLPKNDLVRAVWGVAKRSQGLGMCKSCKKWRPDKELKKMKIYAPGQHTAEEFTFCGDSPCYSHYQCGLEG